MQDRPRFIGILISRGCGRAIARTRRCFLREDADIPAQPALVVKTHNAGDAGEEGVVLTAPDVHSWFMLGAALPNENRAGLNQLAAEAFYAQPLSRRVAAVNR